MTQKVLTSWHAPFAQTSARSFPSTSNPKPILEGKIAIGSVRIMGHGTLDAMLSPDVAGLQSWVGEDLTITPSAALGKIYIRGQQWMGDRYDAVFEPGQPSRIWRNGVALAPLAAGRVWRASKEGETVVFRPVELALCHTSRP